MMYRCDECGHIFDCGEETTWSERRGDFDKELMHGCPICRGDYRTIEPCSICGVYSDGETYCEECKKTIKERFVRLMDANFNRKERALLNELYDCEPI